MLGFAFFFFFNGVFFLCVFPSFSSASHFLGPLQHCSSWCYWCCSHKQLQAALCFKGRVQWGSFSPGTPGAVSQQFFLGKGMGFCCATLPGEWWWEDRLLELGSARSFWRWCKAPGCFGVLNKSCASPWLSVCPLPWQKRLHGLALTGTWSAQLPGVPDMVDRGLQSWPQAAFWGVYWAIEWRH